MSNRIIGVVLGTMGGAALTLASAASAQQGGPPPVIPGSGGGPRAQDVAAANRAVDADYNTLAGRGVQVTDKSRADSRQPRQRGPVAALAADLTAGATVRDRNGVQIATVEGLEADGAVVKTGDRLAKLPLDAFGKDNAGLLLGITAAEFQAAIAASSVPVPVEEPEIAAATAADMTPGAAIRDSEGVPIGTVQEVVENGVVILTDGKKVKLAVESFGKDDQGLLIGITASEFKAMIGNRSAATPGA
jgi:hypothetical protein